MAEEETIVTLELNEHEAAMIAVALTLLFLEETLGVVTEPAPPDVLARDFPVLVSLFDRIGQPMIGEGIDPDLVATFNAKLGQLAAEEREKRAREN